MSKRSTARACPSGTTLTMLAEGRLAAIDSASVEAHIDQCAGCQATLRVFGAISMAGQPVRTDSGGEVVPAPYHLHHELGCGSQGVVWRARDARLGRDVALKVVRLDDFGLVSRGLRPAPRDRFASMATVRFNLQQVREAAAQ